VSTFALLLWDCALVAYIKTWLVSAQNSGDSLPEVADLHPADSKNDTFGYFRIVTLGSVAYDPLKFLDVFSFLSV
jgi:hypothetical protein